MIKYTDSHEWIKQNDETNATVGITMFAKKELGEIVYLELPKVGTEVQAGDEVAVLESTKAAADIYSPVSGIITQVNTKVKDDLHLLNQDPENQGWLFTIEMESKEQLDHLLNKDAYLELVSS